MIPKSKSICDFHVNFIYFMGSLKFGITRVKQYFELQSYGSSSSGNSTLWCIGRKGQLVKQFKQQYQHQDSLFQKQNLVLSW